jgi:hypothetical protein
MPDDASSTYRRFVEDDYKNRVVAPREQAVGDGSGGPNLYPGARPAILAVTSDTVTVRNAAGFPETVTMEDFNTVWRPGNPGNPAVTMFNEIYRQAWADILTSAGTPPYIASPGLSVELWDAPPAETPELRVERWLQRHLSVITGAEITFGVDRRGIAGAIAWEALQNVYPKFTFGPGDPLVRWAGPGKVHFRTRAGGEEHLAAKQVEDQGMLPARTVDQRGKVLMKPTVAIMYIASIMKMLADVAFKSGYNVYCDPGVLATLYNQFDLEKARDHFTNKKAPDLLQTNDTMGSWVDERIGLLEGIVGKPAPQVCRRAGLARPL